MFFIYSVFYLLFTCKPVRRVKLFGELEAEILSIRGQFALVVV